LGATLAAAATLGAGASQVWHRAAPTNVRQTGAFRGPPLTESSGAIGSRSHRGRFWTLNDSGNPPTLFLADTTGAIRGFVRLAGATNIDWEAISAGPCGSRWCLYVGDVGDNLSIRRSVTIYRVVEPTDRDLQAKTASLLDSLVIRYPEGPRDVEAMVVTRSEGVGLISKGRSGRVDWYWIPPTAWAVGHAAARPIGTLPIRTSIMLGQLVTDAALSEDEATLAARTYQDIYLFRRSATSRWLPDHPWGACSVQGLDIVGEGLAWWTPSTLLMTSEITRMRPGAITLLECRPP
jgi:hypothetical protein